MSLFPGIVLTTKNRVLCCCGFFFDKRHISDVIKSSVAENLGIASVFVVFLRLRQQTFSIVFHMFFPFFFLFCFLKMFFDFLIFRMLLNFSLVVDNGLTLHDVQCTYMHSCLQSVSLDQVQCLFLTAITDARALRINGSRNKIHDPRQKTQGHIS